MILSVLRRMSFGQISQLFDFSLCAGFCHGRLRTKASAHRPGQGQKNTRRSVRRARRRSRLTLLPDGICRYTLSMPKEMLCQKRRQTSVAWVKPRLEKAVTCTP
jgi:hypothetical protein